MIDRYFYERHDVTPIFVYDRALGANAKPIAIVYDLVVAEKLLSILNTPTAPMVVDE